MKYAPHDYQQYLTDKIIENKRIALFVDMGLGKTVSTLTAINELMYNMFEIKHVLIVAPKRVAEVTWIDEISKWEHLNHLTSSKILGTLNDRIKAINKTADVYTIGRDNITWFLDYINTNKIKWKWDMLVIDESSSFKCPTSERFRTLKEICIGNSKRKQKPIKRIVELTGTPAPNGYENLWSQIYLLDGGCRLESCITNFRLKYEDEHVTTSGARYYTMLAESIPLIDDQIKDIAISLKWQGNIQMPDMIDKVIKIKLSDDEKKVVKQLQHDSIVQLQDNETNSLDTIIAKNAISLSGKMLQLANGAVYTDDDKYIVIHNKKLEALQDIVESTESNVMVFYNFKHDLQRLMEYFKEYKPKELKSTKSIEDWNNGKTRLVFAHPASMGHGLNLQMGGSVIVWFSLTYDLELYQQANARLYRQGQHDSVVIHHLVAENTFDEKVYNILNHKGATQNNLMLTLQQFVNENCEVAECLNSPLGVAN